MPFQVLVRAEPVDLEAHLRRVQARTEALPEALRAIALDYVGFLRGLARRSLTAVLVVLHRLAQAARTGYCWPARPTSRRLEELRLAGALSW